MARCRLTRNASAGLNLSVTADAVPPPLTRGGFGIPQSFASSPEAPLPGELSNEVRLRGWTKDDLAGKLLLGSTSPSRLTPCHLPYRGEALAFRKASPLRQRLPYQGQRRRPPPAAETGSRCWGSGQQDASEAPRMPGAATRVRSTSGVTVRPTLDEQSFFILKTAVPCYRGQQLRNNILVKLLLISVAGHYFLRYIRLPVSSRK